MLLDSVDLARRALLEVTPPETVGSVIGHLAEGEHVLTLLFAADLGGYPGWRWSVTLARIDDGGPTVLETELMPGDSALLAPEWVPWSERLADYRAAQEAAAAAAGESADVDGDAIESDDGADGFDAEPGDADGVDDDAELDDEHDEDDDDEDEAASTTTTTTSTTTSPTTSTTAPRSTTSSTASTSTPSTTRSTTMRPTTRGRRR